MALAEAEIGVTGMAMDQGRDRSEGDAQLMVRFFMHPKKDGPASKAAGRDIFKEREYIQILVPGNKESINIRPATKIDIDRFPEHYRRFKARQSEEEGIEGTLLEQWPGVNRSQAEELKFLKIFTVEQLASVSDANAQQVMGINTLRTRAKAFLEASSKQAAADEALRLQEENDQLKANMAEMMERLEALEKPKKRTTRKTSTDDSADATTD